ncbi:hypothetical protein FQR65_LT18623 [Abscondita terminalis]|nr:hypothetical protein FQR65_LT18623 [Abscondita terminalis]
MKLLSKGKGTTLTMTGNLGNVMKESATIALEYIKAKYEELGMTEEQLTDKNIHIHVPEGATPKDGPSAGIAMLTSMVSSFTNKKVKSNLAMTGEITLRGKVLPVGGIKEKLLAATRAGIKDVILCEANRKDVEEIKKEYLKNLNIHYVNKMKEESASMPDANYESAKAVSAEASASATDSISSAASTQVKGKEFVKTASVNMEVKDVYDATIKIEKSTEQIGGEKLTMRVDDKAVMVKYRLAEDMIVKKYPHVNWVDFLQQQINSQEFVFKIRRIINAEM